MPQGISMIEINYEDDVVTARQRARQVARLFSFDEQDQTRISTALSEIARLFVQAHKGGRIEFQLEGSTLPQLLLVTISSTRTAGAKARTGAMGNGGNLGPEWDAALIAASDGPVRSPNQFAGGTRDPPGQNTSASRTALYGQGFGAGG